MTYRNVASLDPGVLPEHRQSTLLFLRLNVTHQWMQFLSWKFGNSLSSCKYCWEETLVCNHGSIRFRNNWCLSWTCTPEQCSLIDLPHWKTYQPCNKHSRVKKTYCRPSQFVFVCNHWFACSLYHVTRILLTWLYV